jgi:hypothetical protein
MQDLPAILNGRQLSKWPLPRGSRPGAPVSHHHAQA